MLENLDLILLQSFIFAGHSFSSVNKTTNLYVNNCMFYSVSGNVSLNIILESSNQCPHKYPYYGNHKLLRPTNTNDSTVYNLLYMDKVLQPLCDVQIFTVVDRIGHIGQCYFLLVCLTHVKVLQHNSHTIKFRHLVTGRRYDRECVC